MNAPVGVSRLTTRRWAVRLPRACVRATLDAAQMHRMFDALNLADAG